MEFNKNQKIALVAVIGLVIIWLSCLYARNLVGASSGSVEVVEAGAGSGTNIVTSGSDQVPNVNENSGKVVFQVAGYVNKPGVYSLPEGQRVNDAINAAGGAMPNADLQSLNLAAKIEDGQRIFVPQAQMVTGGKPVQSSGAVPPTASPAPSTSLAPQAPAKSAGGSGKLKTPGEGTVSINTADVNELQRLPGVGPSTAQKIIDYRAQIGRFSSPEQLMDVKGIGPKKLEKMKPFVSL